MRTLLEHGAPPEQVSIVGRDLHSETHVHGFVTTRGGGQDGSEKRGVGRWAVRCAHRGGTAVHPGRRCAGGTGSPRRGCPGCCRGSRGRRRAGCGARRLVSNGPS
ncbi:MAG: hypothetical protein ACREQ5_02085 [Candidatus Dormibacteria bacterium]